MKSQVSEAALEQLESDKDQIEKEIGQKLEWNPNPDARDKVIALYLPADLRDEEQWPGYIDWIVDTTKRFRKAFSPRVTNLEL